MSGGNTGGGSGGNTGGGSGGAMDDTKKADTSWSPQVQASLAGGLGGAAASYFTGHKSKNAAIVGAGALAGGIAYKMYSESGKSTQAVRALSDLWDQSAKYAAACAGGAAVAVLALGSSGKSAAYAAGGAAVLAYLWGKSLEAKK